MSSFKLTAAEAAKFSERLAVWREHPDIFVREHFGATPDPAQDEALKAFPSSPRLALQSCAGSGKTTTLAWLGWNYMLTRPHPMVGATSITGGNLKANLWAELARWQMKSPLLQAEFEHTNKEIFARAHPKTWKIEARTWAADANADQIGNSLRGLHAQYIMWLLDESGGYPNAIMPVCENIFSGEPIEAHIVQAGNPTNLDGPLYKAATTARTLWYLIVITGDPDDPKRTPRVSIAHARQQIAQYGRDNPWVLVNIFGQFPPSSLNVLIGPEAVAAAMKRYYRDHELGNSPRILGVDVARFGDDSSVICKRRGLQVYPFEQKRNLDSIQGAGWVGRTIDEWNADATFVDNTGGFGAGWIDQLKLINKSPIPVDYSSNAHKKDRYRNKRAEMYLEAVQWIKDGGALPECPELTAALTSTTYTFVPYDGHSVLMLQPKEQVKTAIGYSPDHADSFCFVAGTLVETPAGPVPIDRLREGDVVLTPFGQSEIGKVWVTSANRLSRVKFSNGSILTGRPEHPIFIQGHGAVSLDALSSAMGISPIEDRWKWLLGNALVTKALRIGFKTLVGIFPHVSASTVRECCIGAHGQTTTGQFRRAWRSITKTRIGETTKSAILSWLIRKNMPVFTSISGASGVAPRDSLKRRDDSLLLGMHRPKGCSGTAKTEKRHGMGGNNTDAFAKNAAVRSGVIGRLKPNSVRQAAKRQFLTIDILLFRKLVSGAAKHLWRIATKDVNRHVVPVSVQTEDVRPTSVYNLTLKSDNAYYANGILVFNCQTFAEPVSSRNTAPAGSTRHKADYDPFSSVNKLPSQTGSYDPFR